MSRLRHSASHRKHFLSYIGVRQQKEEGRKGGGNKDGYQSEGSGSWGDVAGGPYQHPRIENAQIC